MNPAELEVFFPEFVEPLQHCHFKDCLHRDEEGCAVRAAVEAGRINLRRYLSYLKMFEETAAGRAGKRDRSQVTFNGVNKRPHFISRHVFLPGSGAALAGAGQCVDRCNCHIWTALRAGAAAAAINDFQTKLCVTRTAPSVNLEDNAADADQRGVNGDVNRHILRRAGNNAIGPSIQLIMTPANPSVAGYARQGHAARVTGRQQQHRMPDA